MNVRITAPILVVVATSCLSAVVIRAQELRQINVVQWNVEDGQQAGEIDAIVAQQPDIVLVQEVDRVSHLDAMVAALEARQGVDWDRRYINRTNTTSGSSLLAILSRFPLSNVRTTRLSSEGEILCGVAMAARAAIGATILVDENPLAVFSTRNHYVQGDCPAREQNRRFRSWANANYPNMTHLYGGDFNMLPGGIAYDVMTEGAAPSTDAWAETVREGAATAFDGNPTFWTPTRNNRLDYLFYRNAATVLDAVSAQILPRNTALSDHRMMTATFTVASTAATTTRDLLPTEDVFIRGGSYADTNFNDAATYPYLATRASSSAEFRRRGLLKFDTNTANVPAGATIVSARLILTVRFTNAAPRTLSVFDVAEGGWLETSATWNHRTPTTRWTSAGATLGAVRATATVGTMVGAEVSFDLTSWVQRVVNGQQPDASRWTRLALVDTAASGTSESYKEFYSAEASVARDMKPRLVVVYR